MLFKKNYWFKEKNQTYLKVYLEQLFRVSVNVILMLNIDE